MTKKTRFRYLRILLLYYKYWLAVDEIARRFNYTPRYVQKVLYSSDMKPYARRLTNGFIYRARQRFAAIIGLMQSTKYHEEIPKQTEGGCVPDQQDESALTNQK